MFYKWGGSDILSISTFNHNIQGFSRLSLLSYCKKNTGLFGNFSQKGGGGSPIPKTLSKFTNMVLEMFPSIQNFLKNKNAP